ncbi:hypothetical protein B0H19DRAFT_1378580 [Mycena capillaripes]|nr:hypothetical protein B0H19DRAFT_1378580 [Mycena capillaripes]
MPHQHAVAENRLNNIVAYLTTALTLFGELNDVFGNSFVQPIEKTVLSLITAVRCVKRNRDESIRLIENIHQVLYAIVNPYINSETTGSVPPKVLAHIGGFAETLHKIYTFVEAQQDGSRIKHFFRHSEMNMLRKDCQNGLDQALEHFQASINTAIFGTIDDMKRQTDTLHHKSWRKPSWIQDALLSAPNDVNHFFFPLPRGLIGGSIPTPELYKWTPGVSISADISIADGPADTWIFQISGTLEQVHITFVDGAPSQNIVWVVGSSVTERQRNSSTGNIMAQTDTIIGTSVIDHRCSYAQNEVALEEDI